MWSAMAGHHHLQCGHQRLREGGSRKSSLQWPLIWDSEKVKLSYKGQAGVKFN